MPLGPEKHRRTICFLIVWELKIENDSQNKKEIISEQWNLNTIELTKNPGMVPQVKKTFTKMEKIGQ